MTLSLLDVQKALYAKLNGDATLSAMITGVYDRVKDGTPFPYVVLGDAVMEDMATQTAAMQRVQVQIEVFSRNGGRKEALEIANRVQLLLHEGSLSISGHTLIEMRVSQASSERLSDGMTYQATLWTELWVQ